MLNIVMFIVIVLSQINFFFFFFFFRSQGTVGSNRPVVQDYASAVLIVPLEGRFGD